MRMHLPSTLAAAALALCMGAGAAALPGNGTRLLIFGEQHDQADQQRQVADGVKELAAQGLLAAVVLEMAEAPQSTATLPRDAGEAQVRDALAWKGWPWDSYAGVVMNAVRAGVPVWGGNLPRATMREAMADTTLDARIDAGARSAIAEAVRSGHCNLLPATQEPGMVRIQIARDRAMAGVVQARLREAAPGQLVLLLTGAQHASRDRGVPLHLALDAAAMRVVMFEPGDPTLRADERRKAVLTPQPDYCESLRQRLAAPPAASAPR